MGRLPLAGLVWLSGAAASVSIGVAALPLPAHFAGVSGLAAPDLPAAPVEADKVSLDAIIALAPFGRAAEPAPPTPEARETAADLTLHGVVLATAPEASSAIISASSGPAEIYTVGRPITAGVSLDAVFGDHVVVRIDGEPETLGFPEPANLASAGSAPPAAAVATPAAAPDEGFAALHAILAAAATSTDESWQ